MAQSDDDVRRWLGEFSTDQLAVAELLCDRWAKDPARVGLYYEDAAGRREQLTFADLGERSRRFAAALAELGVGKGDRVATLLPKRPELPIATLGLWRLGAVHVPLFTAFGPDAIRFRVENSGARVVVTDAANRPKVPQLGDVEVLEIERDWSQLEPVSDIVTLTPDDLFILIYTSGTTGHPKGVEVPVRALASFAAYMNFGLDVREEDVHWNVADPGWAYGLYYGLVGTLLIGRAPIYYNAPFAPQAAYDVIRRYGVTNLAAAPTVYRAMRASGEKPDGLRLRVASSAGEPLNPDVIGWAERELGVPIHDQYGQTELGMVVINSQRSDLRRPLKPGSMGQAMPGFRAVILDGEGNELGPRVHGDIAIDRERSPLMWFRRYWQEPEWTAKRFVNERYYITGDAAEQDADGYVFFSARADDVITSAGYRIGPFEVESTLMTHAAVAEAAVVGKPDDLRGEVVKAYVVLKPGQAASDELAAELTELVKRRLSAHAYPREVEFVAELPKTPSGKIQRFLLRAQKSASATA
jgi:acetyl-CoA synthetase